MATQHAPLPNMIPTCTSLSTCSRRHARQNLQHQATSARPVIPSSQGRRPTAAQPQQVQATQATGCPAGPGPPGVRLYNPPPRGAQRSAPAFGVRTSALNAQRAALDTRHSALDAQCPTLNAQCSALNAQCLASSWMAARIVMLGTSSRDASGVLVSGDVSCAANHSSMAPRS